MRVQWLNKEKTEALLVKGLWWWRLEARVSKKSYYPDARPDWLWTATGKPVPSPEHNVLVSALALDREIEQHDAVWKRPTKLPKARLLR